MFVLLPRLSTTPLFSVLPALRLAEADCPYCRGACWPNLGSSNGSWGADISSGEYERDISAQLLFARKETRSERLYRQPITNAAEALQKLGGAQVILATAPSSKAMSELVDGLGPNGKLIVVGSTFDPIEVTPIQLISGSRTIQGWSTGTPADSEDTLRFAELSGVRPMIETYPLEQAAEAYARMMSGKAQFRVVLTM